VTLVHYSWLRVTWWPWCVSSPIVERTMSSFKLDDSQSCLYPGSHLVRGRMKPPTCQCWTLERKLSLSRIYKLAVQLISSLF
jgi:hypothetical protein